MEHTQGPWKYDEVWALIKGSKGEEVCAVHAGQGDGERVNRNIAYANARLIAAAPALLEACKAVFERITDNDMIMNGTYPLTQQVYAAIAAAEGKE